MVAYLSFIEPKRFRDEYLQLSQIKLARVLQVDLKTVQRWENSCQISPYNMERLLQLRKIFEKHPTYRYGDLAALSALLAKQFEIPDELPQEPQEKAPRALKEPAPTKLADRQRSMQLANEHEANRIREALKSMASKIKDFDDATDPYFIQFWNFAQTVKSVNIEEIDNIWQEAQTNQSSDDHPAD